VRRQTQAESYETEAAKQAKRQQFEQLLHRSLDLAQQSDLHLSGYAQAMHERRAVLMEAQGLCASDEERGRVRQLLNRQGPSWQMGFYGVQRFIEASDWMFARDFNSLEAFTKVRLQNWGVVFPARALPAPDAAATKERVN
jgi:hypothetical protein